MEGGRATLRVLVAWRVAFNAARCVSNMCMAEKMAGLDGLS